MRIANQKIGTMRYKVAHITKLCLTLKDDTTERKPAVNRQTKPQRFIKLKELQADKLANAFAAHLILPNRTQSPPTTLTIEKS